ncbi:MAG TPA: ABC transporter substrate-binding protein [Acetobacteraceae bacterium]|nr:ABC transporter substrate-binding protein [Acetobacteraceae bacterium]
MTGRKTFLAAAALVALVATAATAADTPGVTATEIKIGNTVPYSGPASSYGVLGKLESAFFGMVNEQGGVAGHKINFISLDDNYSPPKTVEQIRRLVEEEQVAFTFATLGTPTNSAIVRYMNQKKVPQLFVSTGADKWGDYKQTPWTIGWQPSYRTEAQIYTKYILQQKPDAKIAILYQNDDFGKDYPNGMKDVLGDKFSKMVTTATYETTDPTVDSQITQLQSSGADVLLVAAIPKFAAQAIRKVHDLNWKPMFFMSNVAISVGAVMTPAGPENGIGIISAAYLKDSTDPTWKDDPGMNEWRGFMTKYMPGADQTDGGYIAAYGLCKTMLQVLQQANGDFSRANIMKQVTSLHDSENPVLLPGIKINTSPTNFHPITAMQLEKWDGKTWVLFGNVIQGAGS